MVSRRLRTLDRSGPRVQTRLRLLCTEQMYNRYRFAKWRASPRPAPLPLSPSFLSLSLLLSLLLYMINAPNARTWERLAPAAGGIIDDSNSRTLRSQTVDPALLLLGHLPFAFFPLF